MLILDSRASRDIRYSRNHRESRYIRYSRESRDVRYSRDRYSRDSTIEKVKTVSSV